MNLDSDETTETEKRLSNDIDEQNTFLEKSRSEEVNPASIEHSTALRILPLDNNQIGLHSNGR